MQCFKKYSITAGRNSFASPVIVPLENHVEIMWLALGCDKLDLESCISPYTFMEVACKYVWNIVIIAQYNLIHFLQIFMTCVIQNFNLHWRERVKLTGIFLPGNVSWIHSGRPPSRKCCYWKFVAMFLIPFPCLSQVYHFLIVWIDIALLLCWYVPRIPFYCSNERHQNACTGP